MYGYSSYKSQEMDWVSKARSVFENNDTSSHDIDDTIFHLISTSHKYKSKYLQGWHAYKGAATVRGTKPASNVMTIIKRKLNNMVVDE